MRYARASFGVLPAAGELRPNERASPSETQLVLLPDVPSYPLGEERERERERLERPRGVRWFERGKMYDHHYRDRRRDWPRGYVCLGDRARIAAIFNACFMIFTI